VATVYEYWQHRVTAAVWAVKLVDGRVVAAVDLHPREVDVGLLEQRHAGGGRPDDNPVQAEAFQCLKASKAAK
jgi:hypothetical protein